MTPKLVGLPYSPWSIKAKWALDHHGIEYRYVSHVPLLGEPMLRWRAKRLGGRVSVPLLVADGEQLMDSFDIARWADRHGSAAALFPKGKEDEVSAWNVRSEMLLSAGRALSIGNLLASRDALAESVPGPRIGNALAPLGWLGAKFVASKYAAFGQPDALRDELRIGLSALEKALGGRDHLIGDRFTYADLAMTVATFPLRAPGPEFDHLGPATRECWAQPEIAAEHPSVLAWRDRMLERHFPRG